MKTTNVSLHCVLRDRLFSWNRQACKAGWLATVSLIVDVISIFLIPSASSGCDRCAFSAVKHDGVNARPCRPIVAITTTTIACLPGSRQGTWVRNSTMSPTRILGWPPWAGKIRLSRIKRCRIDLCRIDLCSPNRVRYRRQPSRPSRARHLRDRRSPSAATSALTWDLARGLPARRPRRRRHGRVCSSECRA